MPLSNRPKSLRVHQNVIELFPEAAFLKQYNAYKYGGFPAVDAEGNVFAAICLLDDKHHDFSEEDKYLMNIFSQRIGAEIECQRTFNERKKPEPQLLQACSDKLYIKRADNIICPFYVCLRLFSYFFVISYFPSLSIWMIALRNLTL